IEIADLWLGCVQRYERSPMISLATLPLASQLRSHIPGKWLQVPHELLPCPHAHFRLLERWNPKGVNPGPFTRLWEFSEIVHHLKDCEFIKIIRRIARNRRATTPKIA